MDAVEKLCCLKVATACRGTYQQAGVHWVYQGVWLHSTPSSESHQGRPGSGRVKALSRMRLRKHGPLEPKGKPAGMVGGHQKTSPCMLTLR